MDRDIALLIAAACDDIKTSVQNLATNTTPTEPTDSAKSLVIEPIAKEVVNEINETEPEAVPESKSGKIDQ